MSKKRQEPTVQEDSDDYEDIKDGEEEEEDSMGKEIQVDFEGYPPLDCDYDGTRKLLKQTFLKEDVDLSGLTETLIKLTDMTIIIKQVEEDEETPCPTDDGSSTEPAEGTSKMEDESMDDELYGVTSLIPLHKTKEGGVISLRNLLVKRGGDFIVQLLKSSKVGFLLNERFVNLPAPICVPAFKSIVSEVLQNEGSIEHIILLSKVLKGRVKLPKSMRKKVKGERDQESVEETIYQNAEEEILKDKSIYSCIYSVKDQQQDGDIRGGNWDEDDIKMTPYREVIVLTFKSFQDVVPELDLMLNKK